ncbi:general secretion pathway protein GspB [Desulfurivibrio sp. C05AmB]|jgi:general secretion pathway protein B|uniref:general secretion pathway protein GspB n=1 Tax=Desulfurivibrio sp. C05AmB TaxID=3374371 RepID=UPI00376F2F86
MSYILEALKKSERERKLGEVPRLDTPQQAGGSEPAKPARTWLVPVLLVNTLLLAGLLGYLVLSSPESPGRPQVGEEPSATAGQPAAEPAAEVLQPGAGPELSPEQPAAPPVSPAAPSPTEPPAASPLTLPLPGPAEQPAPLEPAPRLSELPAAVREQITPPKLEIHVYSESPGRRFVMIGGRQYHEGDRLPGELRLEEITPTGAVLSRHGQAFRIER